MGIYLAGACSPQGPNNHTTRHSAYKHRNCGITILIAVLVVAAEPRVSHPGVRGQGRAVQGAAALQVLQRAPVRHVHRLSCPGASVLPLQARDPQGHQAREPAHWNEGEPGPKLCAKIRTMGVIGSYAGHPQNDRLGAFVMMSFCKSPVHL
jgi:hypothetical protein